MADSTSIPIIVQGNSFSLAIPLQIYVISEGSMVLQDYTPDPTDQVSIQLKGSRRQYTYTPTITGNTAYIELSGNEMADNYGIVVSIVKENGQRLRSFRTDQFFIVESIDELNEGQITEGIEQGAIYLDPEIFIAGKDGRGIVSIVKTATSGLVDTYTITYTDNTTSTFNVTNGKDGINGQDGVDGADGVGIASIAKTGTQGLVDTYTITMTNGTTYTYQVTNGKDGEDGADGQDGTDGVGIVSITKTSTAGLVDTYTIFLTNGTTTTFNVTNGSDATQVQSDWSQSDSSAVDFIKNKPTIPTIPATATQSEISVGSSTEQRTFTPKLIHDNAYISETAGIPLLGLDANKIYDFGTISSALTIPDPLTTSLVSNALNFYALRFIAGADNLNITFPTGVIVDDTPTINTDDYVEIMINKYGSNFYASIKVWQAQ